MKVREKCKVKSVKVSKTDILVKRHIYALQVTCLRFVSDMFIKCIKKPRHVIRLGFNLYYTKILSLN